MTATTRGPGGEDEVVIYTDGACRGNPGLGAYAAILTCRGRERRIFGVVEETTNNRMELEAAIHGLEALRRRSRVRVVTDSQYVHHGMTQWVEGWRRRGWRRSARSEVRNRDLWEKLVGLCERHQVDWQWVPGHGGHAYNERCDRLANQAMDEFLAGRGGGAGT